MSPPLVLLRHMATGMAVKSHTTTQVWGCLPYFVISAAAPGPYLQVLLKGCHPPL